MTRARDEQGIALVATMLMLMIMSGMGLALLLLTNNQQKASAREQASESAFNVAEAGLNSQVSQLSRAWPSKSTEEVASCTAATSTGANYCPDKGSLETGYPNISPATCAGGTPKDPWGSALTNEWTTYVRDNGTTPSSVFSSSVQQTQPAWDANGDGKLWVRSVGVVQCRLVTVITLVSRQEIALNFPHNVITANWFETTNNGNKVIVNTQGDSSQPEKVSVRCEEPHAPPNCTVYQGGKKKQISPETIVQEAGTSPTLSSTQVAALRQQAVAAGHYYPKGTCPTGGVPVGAPVYVEGPCTIVGTGNEVANSKESPGFIVLVEGTFELNKNAIFYGVIYAMDAQNSTEAVVTLHGSAEIVGAIDVDNGGGVFFGSSGTNLVYDSKAIEELKTYAGAGATRNSFRVLPSNQ